MIKIQKRNTSKKEYIKIKNIDYVIKLLFERQNKSKPGRVF